MEPTATLDSALAHAERLLAGRPSMAEAQAAAILEAVPGHPGALFILGAARRRQGRLEAARAVLEPLAAAQPNAPAVHAEWAAVQAGLGQTREALVSVRRALALKPDDPGAWRLMGDLASALEDNAGAAAAYGRQLELADRDAELMRAGVSLARGHLGDAEGLLARRLAAHPTDVAASRMLAEVHTRLGRDAEAETLLERCLGRLPGFTLARHNYAVVLFRQNRFEDALAQLDILLATDPRNPNYRSLLAACQAMLADYDQSAETYARLLAEFPQQAKVWLSYGHALKTKGDREGAVKAYRTATGLNPDLGEAYWSLANMKGDVFAGAEIAAMEARLGGEGLAVEDRFHMRYALGHAYEQGGDYAAAWRHFAEGARLRRSELAYDRDRTSRTLRDLRALMDARFFAERAGVGCPDAAPIFIVGLPRSGSTLLEQILASHSQVEGTLELPEMANIARDLRGEEAEGLPKALAGLTAADRAGLGARYIERTRIYRKTGKPMFIDKMPNNFVYTGLIHLILPNARIIDARRQPMAACFSAFKQHFARGQPFSYDLEDLGQYYTDYVALMAHFDAVLPGRVHRVVYEDLVEDLEGQTRAVLAYCGLAFEPACLRFHENPRPVRTASSEQVRRPIYREGIDQWRNYEAWLGPLARALERGS
jgi:tetratricopeptide (TPR) repeat protein